MMNPEEQDLFAVDEDVEEVWGRPSWGSPYVALEEREEEGGLPGRPSAFGQLKTRGDSQLG